MMHEIINVFILNCWSNEELNETYFKYCDLTAFNFADTEFAIKFMFQSICRCSWCMQISSLAKNYLPRETEDQMQPRQELGLCSCFCQWYTFQNNYFNGIILKCVQFLFIDNHMKI